MSIDTKNFAQDYNIKLTKSAAYHPQSNRLAGRGVQTIKNILKRYLADEKLRNIPLKIKLIKILLSYNNSPCTATNKTPSNIIFAYNPRTHLNCLSKNQNFNEKQNKNNTNNDKRNENKILKRQIKIDKIFKKGGKKSCIEIILKIILSGYRQQYIKL